MSDSGKQTGECRHGRAREWCPEALRAEVEGLRAACQAALNYDQAIQNQAHKQEPWVESAELDRLYAEWIDKARAALKGT